MTKRRNDTFVTLSAVKRKKVQWLWRPYIPFGMLTILEGDPGLDKSFLSMYLAAIVSTGGMLPDGSNVTRGNVLYIGAEDDPSYTTGPRMDALSGDSERIRVLNGRIAFDDEGLETLRAELDENEPELIIIDPWVSFIPADARIKARTGIYLLVGPDPDLPGRQLVYVGEGDQVKTRLAAHDSDESKVDLPRFSGEALGHSAAVFSN